MMLLISTMLVFNTMFIFLNHPMSMGVVLIVQTLLIALFSGLMLPSFWYSYILVLVFLGGLLILFVYVSSMASNEQISSLNPALFLMTLAFISLPIIVLIDSLPSKMMLSPDAESLSSPSYMWIFTSPSSSLALFLMIYLFIVLMAIVKITKFWGGIHPPSSLMSVNMMKTHPLLSVMNSSVVTLPSPSNISIFWNFGSLLGLCLGIQIVSGLFLAMHYASDASLAFKSVIHICYDVNYGWLIRTLHANGASMFFICLFMHTARGMFFGSYQFMHTWNVGVIILFATMATAFLGYVLPWGQMSFWGATVITNLLSAIPYCGTAIVEWLWGGFAVGNPTLSRFFTLHFLLPFVIAALVMIHLIFLHETGSNNPLGLNSNFDKIPFHPYFSIKDLMGFLVAIYLLTVLAMNAPYLLGDPDNFIPANPMSTPVHIKPEWYFLFAYAILRSIPNKLGGVVALVLSILILIILPFTNTYKFRANQFYPVNKILFWTFASIASLLTWIGARPVEEPFIITGQILTVLYFSYFILVPVTSSLWDKKI